MRYHLRTLGHLSLHPGSVREDAVLQDSKSLAMLAYVAAAPGREARRSHLADLLWPASDRKRARRSLRQALYYLSRKADDGLVRSDDGVLAVHPGRLEVDLWRFDEALEAGEWERAVELYDGPFLDGFGVEGGREFEGWLEAQNERVWSGLKAACHRLVREAVEAGDPERAVRHARGYVEVNPLDETAQETLVRAHLSAGDRVGAYRAYERYRALLREELGAEPGPELEERIGELRDRLFAAPGDGDGGAAAPGPPQAAEGTDGDGAGPGEEAPPAEAAGPAGGDAVPGGARPRIGVVARWLAVGVAMGLGLGYVARAMMPGAGAGGVETHTWRGATGRLAAAVQGGEEMVLEVRNGRVEASRVRPSRSRETPAPGGDRTLFRIPTPGGTDVVMVEATGDTTPVAVAGADEGVLGWGPEGRRALLWRGRPTRQGRRYVRRLLVLDGASGEIRTLDTPNLGEAPVRAEWNPLGPHVAFGAEGDSAGGPAAGDIYRVDVDGTGLRRLTLHPAEDRDPAWSPDGRRLAFVSYRAGDGDLHVMDARGEGLERVTFGSSSDMSPVWLSEQHLAFLSDRDGASDVWLIDLQTRSVRRLTRRGGLLRLRALEVPARRRPLRELRIASVPRVASPGQHLTLRAVLRDGDGESVPAERASLRWSTPDEAVISVEPGGRARVVGLGRARVVASAGGWVSDTLRLSSRPLAVRSAAPVLEEDWADGLDDGRWVAFGEPAPFVAPPPGQRQPRRVFVNNGDANYASGAVARRAVSPEEGASVQFQARLPFTDRLYQILVVGLAPGVPEAGTPRWAGMREGLQLTLGGADRSAFHLRGPDGERRRIPRVPDPGAWHRYALQVEPDGRVSLCVDGRMWWRSAGPMVSFPAEQRLHVYLAGRSVGTRLEVGRLRVWEEVRLAPAGGGTAELARSEGAPGS